jgi:SAM-dependent methyltransferase
MPNLVSIARRIAPRRVRAQCRMCPGCGVSLFVKWFDDETGVRCLRCGATPVHLAAIDAVACLLATRPVSTAYEMSSRGALLAYLRRKIPHVVTSELLEGVEPGSCRDGLRCEDVQKLSFANGMFDLCTSTEVFEHVPDDMSGFAEVLRVLKDDGTFVFTVPLNSGELTVERATLVAGELKNLLPATFHGDRLRGDGRVLVFRDYGPDIRDRVLSAGFRRVTIRDPIADYFGYSRKVVVATK